MNEKHFDLIKDSKTPKSIIQILEYMFERKLFVIYNVKEKLE